jgi:hypothetical protein
MKENRLSILQSVAFVTILLFISIFLYQQGDPVSKYFKDKQKIKEIINKKSIKTIVVGSSHASAINPEKLGYADVGYFNTGGADLFESCYQGKILISNLDVTTVFMSISYFSFNYDNNYQISTGEYPRREKRIRIYASYPSFKLIDADYSNLLFGKFSPIVTENHWEDVIGSLVDSTILGLKNANASLSVINHPKRPIKKRENAFILYINAVKKLQTLNDNNASCEDKKEAELRVKYLKQNLIMNSGRFFYNYAETIDLLKYSPMHIYLNAHGVKRGKFVSRITQDMSKNNPQIVAATYKTLTDFVDFALKQDVKLIFISTPFWHTYSETFMGEFKENMSTAMIRLQKEYSIEYIDLSSHPEMVESETFFENSDHLNDVGIDKMSQIISQYLHQ